MAGAMRRAISSDTTRDEPRATAGFD